MAKVAHDHITRDSVDGGELGEHALSHHVVDFVPREARLNQAKQCLQHTLFTAFVQSARL